MQPHALNPLGPDERALLEEMGLLDEHAEAELQLPLGPDERALLEEMGLLDEHARRAFAMLPR